MVTVVSILVFLCAGCSLSMIADHAAASPLSFAFDFSNKSTYISKILLQGDVLLQENHVDLTTATTYGRGNRYLRGRISYVEPVPFFNSTTQEAMSFATQFTFAFKPIQGETRGAGMAFFLSGFPSMVPLSSTGGNLGIMANGIGNAVGSERFIAVVFRTFNTSDDVGIVVSSFFYKSGAFLPNSSLSSGSVTASITFNGTTGMLAASLRFNDDPSLRPVEISYQLTDLGSLLPSEVAVGLSAGTGVNTELHQIMSWSFNSTLPQRTTGQSTKATTRSTLPIVAAACSVVLVAAVIIVFLLRHRLFPCWQNIQLGGLGLRQFSLNQLKKATNNFSHPLGNGAFGFVYKGTLEHKEVAVKKLIVHHIHGVGATDFANEARVLMAIKHKNLVKLLGYCNRGEERLLCFEYLSGGSLDNLIYGKTPGGGLDWCARYLVVQEICSGLQYLHHELDQEQRIVHMDLKASNVLINRNERGDITNVKIADFGLSKFFKADLTHSYTELVIGLKAYMAPEYRNRGRISAKVYIYCFGVLILEIVTGRCASVDDSSVEFIEWVRKEWGNGDVTKLMVGGCSDDCIPQARRCIEIALDCIQEDPDSRPDAIEIRQWLSPSRSCDADDARLIGNAQ